ncbi:uncharacterized protein J3D65DRAFT_550985 [Phyllosticta citribraziliensis]|uniref:Actin-like ATPase domain-containing protein n=1 Tax=Phyllosticta citribraziliensis TaxID=989973 RepID=A0ABR1LXG6_9PEZI
MANQPRIILGLDFGTTCTGVAYGSTVGTVQDIEIISSWPKGSGTCKVPSRIAYRDENPELSVTRWGFRVDHQHVSYTWFKLRLDGDKEVTRGCDVSLFTEFSGILQLPEGRSAKQTCQDFLTNVWVFVEDYLSRKFGAQKVRSVPIDVVMTVPAVWSDAAKYETREAALASGFGARPGDTLRLITEPEAAALTVIHPSANQTTVDPVEVGETFMVCDCGGGTVDVVTYIIKSFNPPEFDEACQGDGGQFGASFIDRNFDQWMTREFGRKYTQILTNRQASHTRMMESFEKAKHDFGSQYDDDKEVYDVCHVDMDHPSTQFYDHEDRTVKIPKDVMEQFFRPIIKKILKLVQTQIDRARMNKHRVCHIILVGGFGENEFLNARMREFCEAKEPPLKLSCPPNCQSAVMRGAVIRGLTPELQPTLRVARCHYGCSVSKRFREGIDKQTSAWMSAFGTKKMAYDRMEWLITKGEAVPPGKTITQMIQKEIKQGEVLDYDEVEIFTCSDDKPPQFEYAPSTKLAACIEIHFTKDELATARSKYSKRLEAYVTLVFYNIEINMSSDLGVLTVVVKHETTGRQMGTATLQFQAED